MGNSLFGKIIHYSIKYIPQFVIRFECHYSLFDKISILNSFRQKAIIGAIIRYPVNPQARIQLHVFAICNRNRLISKYITHPIPLLTYAVLKHRQLMQLFAMCNLNRLKSKYIPHHSDTLIDIYTLYSNTVKSNIQKNSLFELAYMPKTTLLEVKVPRGTF